MTRFSLSSLVVVSLSVSACVASAPVATNPPSEAPPAVTLASAAPSASPAAVAIDASEWVSFTSERYGYTVAQPPTWTATPATRAWAIEIDQRLSGLSRQFEGSDQFAEVSPYAIDGPDDMPMGHPIWFTAFAVDVPAGTSEDRWMADYYASRPWMAPGYCEYADAERRPVSVDGHGGTMIVGDTDCGDSAFVFSDGRVHVFWLDAYDRPAQIPEWRTLKTDLLEAFLSTVEFGR